MTFACVSHKRNSDINDLSNVSKFLELILFADDTNIFYSHTDASYLIEVVSLELKKITC